MSKSNKQGSEQKIKASIPVSSPISKVQEVDDVNDVQEVMPLDASDSFWHKISNGWIPYVIIAILGLLLNMNTFKHEYALDDDIIVCKNEFVLKGMSGLADIFKYDVFESFYRSMNTKAQLAGGRYRPFSVATYALEQEFLGTLSSNQSTYPARWDLNQDKKIDYNETISGFLNDQRDANHNGINEPNEDINKDGLWNEYDAKIKGMGFRHINNVLLYVLSVCCVFLFLSSFFFKNNKLMALLICLVFLAHPIHTEVVANVKSRDEILSLLFMVLTLHFSFKYIQDKKPLQIFWASLCYITALMSKEYGATLLLIVPLALYVYYKKVSIMKYVPLMVGLGAAFLIYYGMRSTVVIGSSDLQNSELLNNPFLFATDDERSATQLFINLKYFLLLLIPTPLSCDYSYNVIAFKDFTNPMVLLSGLVLLVLGFFFVKSILKRSWLAFPLAFMLLHLFLVDNLFFNIGATMGERLVYHTSLGSSILLVWGIATLFNKYLKNGNAFSYSFLIIPIIALYSIKTIARNPSWKNDITLHLTDVKTYPESTMLNGNACTRLIELSEKPINAAMTTKLLDSAKIYGSKSLQLHTKFVNSFLNMGIIYMKQNRQDSASYYWGKVRELYPHHPQLEAMNQTLIQNYYVRAMDYANKDHDLVKAEAELSLALKVTPQNPRLLYDIGGMNFNLKNYARAKALWSQGLQYAPQDTLLINGMRALQANGY